MQLQLTVVKTVNRSKHLSLLNLLTSELKTRCICAAPARYIEMELLNL